MWVVIKKIVVPLNRRLVGTKWVFKCKRDGRYRSRLVALGYTQVAGVDFTDNFSPVVNDVTLRMIPILWIVLGLDIHQMDVETAFLEGILDPSEYVYMHCPDGMHLSFDLCLEVRKGLYGLVQSARVFYMSFYDHITSEECGLWEVKLTNVYSSKLARGV